MAEFFAANLSTIAVALGLCVLVGAIVWYLVRQKKAGKSSCGNHCAHCAMRDKCHKV